MSGRRTDVRPGESAGTRRCAACGHTNPVENSVCFICARNLNIAVAPDVAPRRFAPLDRRSRAAYVASLESEAGAIRWLRRLYRVYAAFYVVLFVRALVATQLQDLPAPTALLVVLLPVVTLAFVIVALWRLSIEPFAWSLVMAGIETLAFGLDVAHGRLQSVHLLAALLLWGAVFTTSRTLALGAALRAGDRSKAVATSDLRLISSLLLLYGGVFLVLMLIEVDVGPDRLWSHRSIHVAFIVLTLAAALLGGKGVLKDSLRFGLRPSHLRWTVAALGAGILLDTLFVAWGQGDWWVSPLGLRWPGWPMVVSLCVATAIVEEWACRGVMWSLVRRRLGQGTTILATATLFALMHGLGHDGGLEAVIPQLFAGLILGILRARTGSLVPGMVVHALGNLYVISLIAGMWAEEGMPLECTLCP